MATTNCNELCNELGSENIFDLPCRIQGRDRGAKDVLVDPKTTVFVIKPLAAVQMFKGSKVQGKIRGEVERFDNSQNVKTRNARLCRRVGLFP